MSNIRPLLLALLVAFITIRPALANETPQSYDRINFQVSATEDVENDTLEVVMYSEQSGQKPSVEAEKVNRAITWALELAKQNSAINVQTLNYRQDPLYRNQSIYAWRVRQSIRLESTEVASLSALVGELQSRLSVASLRYVISSERRSKAETRLISEALTLFKNRAKQITLELGRNNYRIVNLDVITSGLQQAHTRMRTATMMVQSSAVEAPSLEPGVQSVNVQISGIIELEIQQPSLSSSIE